MTETYKLTEQEFKDLFSDDISVKRKKDLINKVEERFSYIIPKIYEIMNRDVSWFDFSNGYRETDGYFDPDIYKENISYEGEFGKTPKGTFEFDTYEYEIPTQWLKEDFEKIFEKEYIDFQEKSKNKNIEKANKSKQDAEKAKLIQESIKAKLTPEELCFINMENPSNAMKRLQKMLKDEEIKKYKSQKQKNK